MAEGQIRFADAAVQGIDPSEAQLALARSRPVARVAQFRQGDATALPFPDKSFGAAVMAAVIFFVPEPGKGVAQMARVIAPGGVVAAYAWDILHGGFPNEPLMAAMRENRAWAAASAKRASRMEALKELWASVGLADTQTKEITVSRTFRDFDDFWSTSTLATNVRAIVAGMSPDEIELRKSSVRKQVSVDALGSVTCFACANAIKGVVARTDLNR